MQGFNLNFHHVILCEEFDIKFYPVSMLKRLCEGRPFSFPVKCEADNIISFQGSIIFVSNFIDIEDQGLLNRLFVISAEVLGIGCLSRTEK